MGRPESRRRLIGAVEPYQAENLGLRRYDRLAHVRAELCLSGAHRHDLGGHVDVFDGREIIRGARRMLGSDEDVGQLVERGKIVGAERAGETDQHQALAAVELYGEHATDPSIHPLYPLRDKVAR
jgi:hypothetical protein